MYALYDLEKKGFIERTTVANTLVPFKGRWLLYYGGADRYIGLAEFVPEADSPFTLAKTGPMAIPTKVREKVEQTWVGPEDAPTKDTP